MMDEYDAELSRDCLYDPEGLLDNPKALIAADTLIDIRAATPARQRRKELAEAQEQRLRLLQRDGFVCRIGANGMTVFKGHELWPACHTQ